MASGSCAPRTTTTSPPRRHLLFPSQIRKFDLQTGRHVSGQIRPPKEGGALLALIKGRAVNFEAPDQARDKLFFETSQPLYPLERIKLETERRTCRPCDVI